MPKKLKVDMAAAVAKFNRREFTLKKDLHASVLEYVLTGEADEILGHEEDRKDEFEEYMVRFEEKLKNTNGPLRFGPFVEAQAPLVDKYLP